MNETTVIRRTIKIDGSAKTNVRWFKKKKRLPRKQKKWMKQRYPTRWKFMSFGFPDNKIF